VENIDLEQAQSTLAGFQVDQFDEVLPIPIKVSFMDYVPYKAGEDLNGQPIIRNKPVPRMAEISTYVPMKIFHGLIASQKKLRKIRDAAAKLDNAVDDETFTWMGEQVLGVWVLTEPDMTLDRLISGLDMFKIMGLFSLFFDSLLKHLNQKL
jgi:hypothetical protein